MYLNDMPCHTSDKLGTILFWSWGKKKNKQHMRKKKTKMGKKEREKW